MKNILEKLFLHHGFQRPDNSSEIIFYQKESNANTQEFFLVHDIDKNKFSDTEDIVGETLEAFSNYKSLHSDVAKNTSYILTLKVENLCEDLLNFKNRILKLEEDTYWFKKYVIVYTDSSIASFNASTDLYEHLKSQLHNKDLFQAFKEDIFNNESYFVTVQLFLKLPFLTVPVDNNSELVSIESMMNSALSTRQQNLFATLRELGDIHESTNWQQIEELAMRQDSSESLIDEFLAKFVDNAQA